MHLPGESLAVTVHMGGRALGDLHAPEHAEFRQTLLDVYTPRYGPEWENFLDSGPLYARIEADRMFAFSDPGARRLSVRECVTDRGLVGGLQSSAVLPAQHFAPKGCALARNPRIRTSFFRLIPLNRFTHGRESTGTPRSRGSLGQRSAPPPLSSTFGARSHG